MDHSREAGRRQIRQHGMLTGCHVTALSGD
jgi:hypothetical protein